MSAHVEVIATDLRRAKVKVNQGTFLIDVLNEACGKLRVSSDKFLLKYKNKNVDLTSPFRTAGLSPGAKLDLVVKSSSPSVVDVALTVASRDPAKGPLTKQLRSDMTLWQMLRQFEHAEKGLDITGRGVPLASNGAAQSGSGQLYYEEPVVNIMGKEYASLADLQKTLSQCGINSGKMRIRVDFRKSTKTLFDAMNEISEYMKEVEPEAPKEEPKPAETPTAKETTETGATPAAQPTAEASSAPEPPTETTVVPTATSDAMDIDSTQPTDPPAPVTVTEPSGSTDPLQPTSVFSAPTSTTPAAALTAEADSVYEPTIAHAQLRQQQLQARAQNTRLKSDAELAADAAEQAARLARVTSVLVKVRFPDQTVAQWTVGPEHTGAFLYRAVRGVMAHADAPFKLVLPHGAGSASSGAIRDDERPLIKGYGLTVSTLLNLVWEESASEAARGAAFMKDSVASRATQVVVPEIPQGPEEDDSAARPAARPGKSSGSGGQGGDGMAKKLPKWLKLPGGKK